MRILILVVLLTSAAAAQDLKPQAPQPGTLWAGATKCIYGEGEDVSFLLQSPLAVPIKYSIREDIRVAPAKQGIVTPMPNTPVPVKFTPKRPGFLLLEAEQSGKKTLAAVAIAPPRILSVAHEPRDFDSFWKGELAALAKVPLNAQVTIRKDKSAPGVGPHQVRKVVLDQVEGRKIYGWMVVPDGPGPFPAILEFPAYGSTAIKPPSGVYGAISAVISVHNSDLEKPATNAYQPGNEANHRKNYFKYAILGGVRMIDYLQTISSFDRQHLITTGKSQGGGLSIMVAGLDSRVSHVNSVVPAFGQHAGTRHGRSSGFPWWVWQQDKDGNMEGGTRLLPELEYYDITHFARRFKGTAHVMAGWVDTVCPPSSVVAAYNAFPGPKELVHGPLQGHDWNQHGENWWPIWNGRLKRWVQGFRRPR